jgi:hypothetical protein
MLYIVELYKPNVYEPCHDVAESRVVGSRRAAELLANYWLPVVYDTVYSSRIDRYPYAVIRQTKNNRVATVNPTNNGLHCYYVNTPIRYVPSVGDLGYTP